MRLLFVLLFVYSAQCTSYNASEKEAETKRRTLIEQLTKTRTVLLEGYHLVTRQVATDILMYRSYRTVTLIFYPIVRDVTEARFTFQSEELQLNNIGSCSPQDVIIHLKRGSYPAVNPDGYKFPQHFVDPSKRGEDIYTIEIKSDGRNKTFVVESPRPGNWYALVFIKWEDPRKQKVQQQGLVASCNTILYTDLQVRRDEDIENIDCYSDLEVNYSDLPGNFKCIALEGIEPIVFNLTVTNTANSSKLLFRVQALSVPTNESYLISCAFDPKLANSQSITFIPSPNSWHYIRIEAVQNTSHHADCESYFYRTDLEETYNNHTIDDLMRDDSGRFFTFNIGIPTVDIQDVTSLINLTSGEIKSLRFKLNQFLDIGGNLNIEASLLMSFKYYMGYTRPARKFLDKSLLGFTEDSKFFKVVICLDIEHTSIPLDTGHCKFNDKVRPALFVLNSTDSTTIHEKVTIPYPDSGTWYLTLRLFCDNSVCPCKTSANGSTYYVESEGGVVSTESVDVSNVTREGEATCNTSVVLAINSFSCPSGRCANYGSCMLNTVGGMVLSFCNCLTGYGGWDCSDDSRMDSWTLMLISLLLLSLSNLLFFFSIYIALIRRYYTEALMYAFTMVFSTFYHACDAPPQIAMCITRVRLLQFGDFYCGIMCFWLTLLAMSIIGDRIKSSLQLTGAIFVALLTTWNMHSILAFLFPVAIGVTILAASWGSDYWNNKKLPYPRSYYTKHLPIGLVLVSIGLICFAFLQTEQNYMIVHSLWHGIIAVSVAFLLPDVRREDNANPFLPSPNACKMMWCKVFKKEAPRPLPVTNTSTATEPLTESPTPTTTTATTQS